MLRALLAACALAALPLSSAAALSPACFARDGVQALTGTLVEGQGQDLTGRAERYWALQLPRPACLLAGSDAGAEPRHDDLAAVQLLVPDDVLRARLPHLRGALVTVTGQYREAETVHHHTPVILDAIRVVPTDAR